MTREPRAGGVELRISKSQVSRLCDEIDDKVHTSSTARSKLYEIRARDMALGIPDPDWGDGPLDARKARLLDVFEDTSAKSLRYLYDFGDGWEHTIKIERLIDAVPGVSYPP